MWIARAVTKVSRDAAGQHRERPHGRPVGEILPFEDASELKANLLGALPLKPDANNDKELRH